MDKSDENSRLLMPRATYQEELKSDKLGPSSLFKQRNSEEGSLESALNRSRIINDDTSIFGDPDLGAKDKKSDETAADDEELFFSQPKRQFVIFGHKQYAKEFCSNQIQTSKYNFFSFLPLNLFLQFSKTANLYFLVISLLQMVPAISITMGRPTILSGLIPVILVSMFKDLFEDLKRRSEDNIENSLRVQRIDKITHGFQDDQWKNLKVGQVIKVNKNQRFPADLILLKSSDPNGIAYVETVNLDGETNLKHKQAIRDMQDAISSPADAGTVDGTIHCDFPNDQLYNFEGMMQL